MAGTLVKDHSDGKKADPAPIPPRTEGLNPLDRERASSIADEGGASAAEVEAQPPAPPAPASDKRGTGSTPTKRPKS